MRDLNNIADAAATGKHGKVALLAELITMRLRSDPSLDQIVLQNPNFTSVLMQKIRETTTSQEMDDAVSSSSFGKSPATGAAAAADIFRDPLGILIPITVIYAIIFILGWVGNIITCIVISRNKSMHTATNFYLFNLAISDMLLLVSAMPTEVYNSWFPAQYPFGGMFCMLQGLLAETSINVNVLTISSFTIERYIAICHPFRQQAMSKLTRAIKIIIGVWIAALGLALPQACQFGVISVDGSVLCTIKNPSISYAFEISSCLFFVGPMILICVLYILIGVRLRESRSLSERFKESCQQRALTNAHNNNINPSNNNNNNTLNNYNIRDLHPNIRYDQIGHHRRIQPTAAQSRIIRMLIAVVVSFFLCWSPFHAQRLIAIYGSTSQSKPKSSMYYSFYIVLTYISGVMVFLSTCINPLLYNIMSHKFRNAFKTTIGPNCIKYEWKRRGSSKTGGSWKVTTTTTSQRQATVPDLIDVKQSVKPIELVTIDE